MCNDDTETSGQKEANMALAHACAVVAILTALRRVLLCVSVDGSVGFATADAPHLRVPSVLGSPPLPMCHSSCTPLSLAQLHGDRRFGFWSLPLLPFVLVHGDAIMPNQSRRVA